MVKCYGDHVGSCPAKGSKKFVLNLSEYDFTDHEESVLRKGLNSTIVDILDIAGDVESVIPKLPPISGIEFRWNVRSKLQKSKAPTSIISKKELKAVKSLKLNKDIRILPADKSNCSVVLEVMEYRDKIDTLLKSGVYELLSKDPAAKLREKFSKSWPNT
jgi:hypothetical protein